MSTQKEKYVATLGDKVAATLASIFVLLCITAFFLDGWGVAEFRAWDAPTEEEQQIDALRSSLQDQIRNYDYEREKLEAYLRINK